MCCWFTRKMESLTFVYERYHSSWARKWGLPGMQFIVETNSCKQAANCAELAQNAHQLVRVNIDYSKVCVCVWSVHMRLCDVYSNFQHEALVGSGFSHLLKTECFCHSASRKRVGFFCALCGSVFVTYVHSYVRVSVSGGTSPTTWR